MSESNNNVPMRITQLEEAETFDYESYLPVAKAGTGTKKVKGSTLLANLDNKIVNIETLSDELNLTWSIGGLNNYGGENNNTNRIRTPYTDVTNKTYLYLNISENYNVNVFRFDASKNLLGFSGWLGASTPITLTNLSYIRLAVKRIDDADMSTSEGAYTTVNYSNNFLDELEKITEIDETKEDIKIIFNDYYTPDYDNGNEITVTFDNGYYWNIEGEKAIKTSNGSFRASTPITVESGEYYRLYANAGGSLKLASYVVVDADYNILIHGTRSATQYIQTDEFKIPTNGKYLLVTVMYGSTITELTKAVLIATNDLLKNKTVAIIGDSISTNGTDGDFPNVPEITVQAADVGVELKAYLTYYDVQGGLSLGGHTFTSDEIGTEVTFTPTNDDIGKKIGLPNNYNPASTVVWWEVMKEQLGFNPIPACWSGSSITSHEGNTAQYKTSYAWHEAQIRKCGIRTAGTMNRTAPDVVFIYRGTNDFSHSPYTLLTDNYFDNYNWTYPENDSVSGGYGYKEGLCLTIKKIRDAYPNAKIFLCTLNVFKRINYSHFPTNNGINSLPQYNDAIREVADFMGCGVINFDQDGITFENCYSQGYITDSATIPTHPSNKGHKAMGLKAIADIKAQYSNMT